MNKLSYPTPDALIWGKFQRKQVFTKEGEQMGTPRELLEPEQPRRKFRNIKTEYAGQKFDSRKEANRYAELRLMERAGAIYELRRQVVFEIIPTQKDEETGETVERPAKYIADFVYRDAFTHKLIVEDVKSKATKTPEYILKRKLMYYRFGIRITEV